MRNTARCVVALGLLFAMCHRGTAAPSGDENLVKNGRFTTLDSWQQNDTLRRFGRVVLLPEEHGVRVENSHHTQDGTLFQTIRVRGPAWLEISCRVKHGANTGASVAVVALDRTGRPLQTLIPFHIGTWESTRWDSYRKTVSLPASTVRVRVELSVLCGSCSFADLTVRRVPKPAPSRPRMHLLPNQGFSVQRLEVERPLWEILVDDLDGDGQEELVACDVDGQVTIRGVGQPPTARYQPGALVHHFATADLNGDGRKEILLTTTDPRASLQAIDLSGRPVAFSQTPCRGLIEAADMDADGKPEVAVAVSGGVAVLDHRGKKLWQVEYRLSEFHFADVDPRPGLELVVAYGGPRTQFVVFNQSGKRLKTVQYKDDRRIFLREFRVADVDGDHAAEIVVLRDDHSVLCLRGDQLVWKNKLPNGLLGDLGLVRVADFVPSLDGLETAVIGTHYVFLLDAHGTVVYQSSATRRSADTFLRQWTPQKLRPLTAVVGAGRPAELYLGSSGLRDPAYYRLRFGARDQLSHYKVPDHERHLDALYQAVRSRRALPVVGHAKFKIVYTRNWAKESEQSLRALRRLLDRLETPWLEYTLMYDPSDLKAHPRGVKMTTDQIVERAKLFERLRLPFGYFAVHGGQAWISDEAIERTIEAAPTMFRFLYVAEDTEGFYDARFKPFMAWCDRMLKLCKQHGLRLLFKEKHDTWAVVASDPEIAARWFKPEYRDTIVPLYSTNQVFEPEVQWSGLVGLKAAGLCREFGMSTQWWNWGEWRNREVNAAFVCPSDITLRLELLGAALGATWFHIEGGQPYLENDFTKGFSPLVTRHRELVYELMRKGLLNPNLPLANRNKAVVVRSFHPALAKAKAEGRKIIYPYPWRNEPSLRKGFLAAVQLFEPYRPDAFPRIAYGSKFNGQTCFPTTPYGWVPIVPAGVGSLQTQLTVETDGDRVKVGGRWRQADEAVSEIRDVFRRGAGDLPLQATGACVAVRGPLDDGHQYLVYLLDPGYLAPQGATATLRAQDGRTLQAVDLVTGQTVPCRGGSCTVRIEPGAFRVLKVTLR